MDKMVGRVISHRMLVVVKILSVLIIIIFLTPFIQSLVSVINAVGLNSHELLATHSSALLNSYIYALLSALITCLFGLFCALVLFIEYSAGTRRNIAFLCLIPFFASTAARLFSWVLLFSSFGVVGRLLHALHILPQQESPLSLPSTLVFSFVTIYLPMAVFAFYSFGSTVSLSAEEAASVLGANKVSVALRIRWRRLVLASLAVFLFVFVSCHGAFMVPSVLGGSAGWFVSTSVDYLLNTALRRDAAFFLSNIDTFIIASTLMVLMLAYALVRVIKAERRKQ